ncbi:MAG: peptide deformylase [Bacteroidota bacterium]
MILPIYTYGQPVLRQRAETIAGDSPELQTLIDDMIETMHGASGLGLAAPQVGKALRLFVADLSGMAEDLAEDNGGVVPDYAQGPLVFINPEVVLDDDSEAVDWEEGCLSIPDLRETVWRPERIRIRYQDRAFETHEQDVDGSLARVIQHEYDHVEGVLFVDHITALRKRMLQRRLRAMARGEVEAEYLIQPPA